MNEIVNEYSGQNHFKKVNKEEPQKMGGCLKFAIISVLSITALLILGLCLVVGIFIIAISSLTPQIKSTYSPDFEEEYVTGDSSSKNKIVVIEVKGVILSGGNGSMYNIADSNMIKAQLIQASKDPDVKAVVIDIDSPGGEVTAADVIYHNINKLRTTRNIPVVAYLNSLAASGGYYVATGCDYIVSHRLTITGSIGVIASTYNYHKLLDKIGVSSEVYKAGAMKDMLNGSRPRTEKEIEIMQGLIDETYDEFVKIVAAGRPGLTVEDIKKSVVGDARVVHGKEALKLKLVDQLGFFEDALDKASEMSGISNNFCVVRYTPPFSFSQLFSQIQGPDKKIKVELPETKSWESVMKPGKLYLLPTW